MQDRVSICGDCLGKFKLHFLASPQQFRAISIHHHTKKAWNSVTFSVREATSTATTVNIYSVCSHGNSHPTPDRSTQKVGQGQPTNRCGSRRLEKWPFPDPKFG